GRRLVEASAKCFEIIEDPFGSAVLDSGMRFAFVSASMIDNVTNQLQTFMDLLSTRQKLVASNIANADTPGYKTQDLDFQSEFMSLARGEEPQAIQAQGLT